MLGVADIVRESMQIKNTTVWCGITKKALLGYSRFTNLPSVIHISHDGDGTLRMLALLENGADNLEFAFKFSSPEDMRQVARIFNAAAELRDAMATPNVKVSSGAQTPAKTAAGSPSAAP